MTKQTSIAAGDKRRASAVRSPDVEHPFPMIRSNWRAAFPAACSESKLDSGSRDIVFDADPCQTDGDRLMKPVASSAAARRPPILTPSGQAFRVPERKRSRLTE